MNDSGLTSGPLSEKTRSKFDTARKDGFGEPSADTSPKPLRAAHLLLVGDALFGEEAYAASLRAQAARLGLGDRVHFLGFRSDVPRLMRTVDIVAHTSSAPEPFGRVVVEGMLAQRPVIATGAGGVPEIVSAGTGVLVPPGDATALAAAFTRLLSDPEFAAGVARKGREHATTHFTVEEMVDRKTSRIEAAIRMKAA